MQANQQPNQQEQIQQQQIPKPQQQQQAQMQQLQSTAPNVVPTGNMPNMSTAGNTMNQMNQMQMQMNMQSKAGGAMNQAGMQPNLGPGGMPFNSGNMPSMMQGNTMSQQQPNQPNPQAQQAQANMQQLTAQQRQQQLNQLLHQQQLRARQMRAANAEMETESADNQPNNIINSAMQGQAQNHNQGMGQTMNNQQQIGQQQPQAQQQQFNQMNFNQMPTTSAQNQPTPTTQSQQPSGQQQMFNQGGPMNRFERPQMNNSKQALSMMLRQRNPTSLMNTPQ